MLHSRRNFLATASANCLTVAAAQMMGTHFPFVVESSGFIPPEQAGMSENFARIDAEMRAKGIHQDPHHGKDVFFRLSGQDAV